MLQFSHTKHTSSNKWFVLWRLDATIWMHLFYRRCIRLHAVLISAWEKCNWLSHTITNSGHLSTNVSKVCFWLLECHCYLQRLVMFIWCWDNRNYFSLCSNIILDGCMSAIPLLTLFSSSAQFYHIVWGWASSCPYVSPSTALPDA